MKQSLSKHIFDVLLPTIIGLLYGHEMRHILTIYCPSIARVLNPVSVSFDIVLILAYLYLLFE